MNLHIIQNQELLKTSGWDFLNKGHSKPLSSKNLSVLCSVAKKKWEDKKYSGPHPQIQKQKFQNLKILHFSDIFSHQPNHKIMIQAPFDAEPIATQKLKIIL